MVHGRCHGLAVVMEASHSRIAVFRFVLQDRFDKWCEEGSSDFRFVSHSDLVANGTAAKSKRSSSTGEWGERYFQGHLAKKRKNPNFAFISPFTFQNELCLRRSTRLSGDVRIQLESRGLLRLRTPSSLSRNYVPPPYHDLACVRGTDQTDCVHVRVLMVEMCLGNVRMVSCMSVKKTSIISLKKEPCYFLNAK